MKLYVVTKMSFAPRYKENIANQEYCENLVLCICNHIECAINIVFGGTRLWDTCSWIHVNTLESRDQTTDIYLENEFLDNP